MISNEALLERVLRFPRLALILDYDGTLAEFAPTPEHLEPNREVVELLEKLTASPRVSAAVLSGRRLDAVEALVPVEGMMLAGSYGIEVRLADGGRIERLRLDEVRPFLDRLLPRWRGLIDGREGFFLEDKRWSLAIHARFAQAVEAAKVLAEARSSAYELGMPPGFRIMGDERFLETAPVSANKRDGVRFLLGRMNTAGALLYLGDDDKDLEAFEAVHEATGFAAIVGSRFPPETSKADCAFTDPASLRSWLRLLASRL